MRQLAFDFSAPKKSLPLPTKFPTLAFSRPYNQEATKQAIETVWNYTNHVEKTITRETFNTLITAAEANHINAIRWLVRAYHLTPFLDLSEAFRWSKRGADLGDASLAHQAGQHLLINGGTKASQAEGFRITTRAADQNYAPALRQLAECYSQGLGTAKSPTKAIEYYTRAAALGDYQAQKALQFLSLPRRL